MKKYGAHILTVLAVPAYFGIDRLAVYFVQQTSNNNIFIFSMWIQAVMAVGVMLMWGRRYENIRLETQRKIDEERWDRAKRQRDLMDT